MFKPTIEEAQARRGEGRHIAVFTEMYADLKTPIALLLSIMPESKKYFLLESVEGGEKWARYSFLGYDPKATIECRGFEVNGEVVANPLEALREVLAQYKIVKDEALPPFAGGLVGYFSYDFISQTEGVSLRSKDDLGFADYSFMLFEKVIAYDHFKQKLIIISNIETENLEGSYPQAVKELGEIRAKIGANVGSAPERMQAGEFKSNMTKEKYEQDVVRAKEYIRDGDIFQVVLSQRFEAEVEGSLLNAYRVLRTTNPSPYMYFMRNDDVELAGSSPETLVRVQKGEVTTFPIAGTRKRGKNEAEDLALEADLLADEKELAEHNMLVDLGRNDVGRVSKFGSVHVDEYKQVTKFSHVMHISSQVKGELAQDKDCLDALASILPAGTLSGAPKIRACEIIDEIEGVRRGVYGGAVGYIDFSGNMDMCITIRTIAKKGKRAFVQTGAGIVADSVPESEFVETVNKAKALMEAVKQASGEVF
ncbi:MAG: anthranilate synthase component I [Bacillota bacterium]